MNETKVEFYFKKLLEEGLYLDLKDPNLINTPKRVAKMYCHELLKGLNTNNPIISTFPNNNKYNQIILSDKILFSSLCSHHFLPFSGYAWVMYIPDKSLIGLSKMTRVVNHFASRPQLQEQLTHDIINFISNKLKPKGIMVVIRATHQCMICRGVKQHSGAGMVTSAIYGEFEKAEVRAEGLSLIQLGL